MLQFTGILISKLFPAASFNVIFFMNKISLNFRLFRPWISKISVMKMF